MNRVNSRFLRDAQNGFDIEVGGERASGRAQLVALVGLETMQGETVFLRVHGNRSDPELRGTAHYPNRNLAAVGNEKLPDGLFHRLVWRKPKTKGDMLQEGPRPGSRPVDPDTTGLRIGPIVDEVLWQTPSPACEPAQRATCHCTQSGVYQDHRFRLTRSPLSLTSLRHSRRIGLKRSSSVCIPNDIPSVSLFPECRRKPFWLRTRQKPERCAPCGLRCERMRRHA